MKRFTAAELEQVMVAAERLGGTSRHWFLEHAVNLINDAIRTQEQLDEAERLAPIRRLANVPVQRCPTREGYWSDPGNDAEMEWVKPGGVVRIPADVSRHHRSCALRRGSGACSC